MYFLITSVFFPVVVTYLYGHFKGKEVEQKKCMGGRLIHFVVIY